MYGHRYHTAGLRVGIFLAVAVAAVWHCSVATAHAGAQPPRLPISRIVFDIEINSLPQWTDGISEKRSLAGQAMALWQRLRDECIDAQAAVAGAGEGARRLTLSAVQQMDFDHVGINVGNLDDEPSRAALEGSLALLPDSCVNPTRSVNEGTRPLSDLYQLLLDEVIVTSYRDVATGVDSIESHARGEVVFGECVNEALSDSGKEVVVALETRDAGLDKVDFSGETWAYFTQEVDAAQSALHDLLAASDGEPGAAHRMQPAFAVNDYGGMVQLLDDAGGDAQPPATPLHVFVWDTAAYEDGAAGDAARDAMLELVERANVAGVYLESEALSYGDHTEAALTGARTLVRRLFDAGVEVGLLYGHHPWAETANHDEVVGLCQLGAGLAAQLNAVLLAEDGGSSGESSGTSRSGSDDDEGSNAASSAASDVGDGEDGEASGSDSGEDGSSSDSSSDAPGPDNDDGSAGSEVSGAASLSAATTAVAAAFVSVALLLRSPAA